MLYGTVCWAVKKQYVSKMNVAEMRMLRWMYGKTRRDKVRNERIRKMIEVAPIEEKMRENRLHGLVIFKEDQQIPPLGRVMLSTLRVMLEDEGDQN